MQRSPFSLVLLLALAVLLVLAVIPGAAADRPPFGCPRKCVPKKLRLRKGLPRFRCPRRYCKKRRCRAVVFKKRGKFGPRRKRVRGVKCVPKFFKPTPPPSPSPSSTPSATPSPSMKPCTTRCTRYVSFCRPGCVLVRCPPRFPYAGRAAELDESSEHAADDFADDDDEDDEDEEDMSLDGEAAVRGRRRRRRRRGRFQCVLKPAPSNPVHMRLAVEKEAAVDAGEKDADVDAPASRDDADKSPFKFWFF